ncbi:hypothetical protein LPJ70_000531 [Coemansia sp. RSA 2708]|nr:hypothetical protein LPJ70_000531 [Coemansia sp. RSA 2708]
MSQLFVGRLPRDVESSEVERVFEKFGKLVRCDIKRGTSLRYGFVEFENSEHAEDAMRECDGMTIQGGRIVVERATGAARPRDDNSCFRCRHWAKDCPEFSSRRGGRSRSRSRSRSPYDRGGRHRSDRNDRNDRSDRREYRGRRRSPESRSPAYRRPRSPRRDPGRDSGRDSGRPHRHHSRSRSREHRRRDPGRDSGRARRPASRSLERRSNGDAQKWEADSAVGDSHRNEAMAA